MKRILLLAVCLLMVCSCTLTVSAAESGKYANAGQLYNAWMAQGGVPDYISAVWSTDGGMDNLTFGLVRGEAGEKGEQEIYDLVRDDSTVTIVYQTYSRNYLYRIQDELVGAYFGQDLGLVSAGVNEYENTLVFQVHTDYANHADTQEMIHRVTEQYGTAVTFQYVGAYPQLTQELLVTAPTEPAVLQAKPQNQVFPMELVFGGSILLLAGFLFILLQRRRVLAAADGSTVLLGDKSLGKKELEESIRNTAAPVPRSLDQRVMESIGLDAKDRNQ